MLDVAEYLSSNDLVGKKVLEPSFGDGEILEGIVRRYINCALNHGLSKKAISEGLSNDIYGIEIDNELFKIGLNRLDHLVHEYELPKVVWKFFNINTLKWESAIRFDFIIGNPPYITYHEIDPVERNFVKEKFVSCGFGRFDYCYAFIEQGINLLSRFGTLVQLVPNSIYKNVYAERLRTILLPGVIEVQEYPDNKLFKDALTTVSILKFKNNKYSKTLKYYNRTMGKMSILQKDALKDKWVFEEPHDPDGTSVRFGDLFDVHNSVVTLLNRAFILDEKIITDRKIEDDILRPAVSPKSLKYGRKEWIIYPYKNQGKLIRFYEDELFDKFPHAMSYLSQFKSELLRRSSDKNTKWFEYGRTQALAHIMKEKVVISNTITSVTNPESVRSSVIPYAGLCVTIKDKDSSLNEAVSILKSEQFIEYARSIGVKINGKSVRITSRDILGYRFIRRNNGKIAIHN